jgi:hypothetical protein
MLEPERSGGVYENTPLRLLYVSAPPPLAAFVLTEKSVNARPPPLEAAPAIQLDPSYLRTCPVVGATDKSTSASSPIEEPVSSNWIQAPACAKYP